MTAPTPSTADTDNQPVHAPSASEPKPKRIRAPKLTGQQRDFVYEYVKCWNGAKAARRAGYSPSCADVTASRLLSSKRIQEALLPMMRSLHLNPDAVMTQLSVQAHADYGDFLARTPDGKVTGEIDLEAVAKQGHLVKSLERKEFGYKLELHDRMRAIELIARILRMTGEGNQTNVAVPIRFEVNFDPDMI